MSTERTFAVNPFHSAGRFVARYYCEDGRRIEARFASPEDRGEHIDANLMLDRITKIECRSEQCQ